MAIDPNMVLLVIALVNAFTAFMAWKTKNIAQDTKVAAEKTEVNTNHMREQLVAATGDAAHAAGKEEGRAEGVAKAAILAEGNLAGKTREKPAV